MWFSLILGCVIGAMFLYQKAKEPQNAAQKMQVSASFYPLYFFASEIGGDLTHVKNITPVGAEPHDYDPSAADIARIEKSDMFIVNGGVEPWADKIKESLKEAHVVTVVAAEGLMNRRITQEGIAVVDPHVWLSPPLAKKEVSKITEGFIKIDPKNSSYYQANRKKLDERLDQLDQKYKQGLINCEQKDIITSHVAFGYLAGAYGLTQVSISGLSPDGEPSTAQLAELVKFAKDHGVKYIFFESLVSPKLAETIASEVGAKTLALDPLEGLSDADNKQGKNYFSVMEENLRNLQIALQCNI